MTLLLDTSILIDIERREKKLLEKIEDIVETDPVPACITFMNYFEFIHGLKAKSPRNKEKSLAFIEKFYCLHPTKNTAVILSDLKHKYDKHGKSFSLSDLLIASHAVENGMTLVTRDKHFQEIDELGKIILT